MARVLGKPSGKTSPNSSFVKVNQEDDDKTDQSKELELTEFKKKRLEEWKAMSEEEKQRFHEMARTENERRLEEALLRQLDEFKEVYLAQVESGDPERINYAMNVLKGTMKYMTRSKRPLTPYLVFSKQKRSEVGRLHPEWKFAQVAHKLGKMWKGLDDNEKRCYSQATAEYATSSEMRLGANRPAAGAGASTSVHYHDDDDEIQEVDNDYLFTRAINRTKLALSKYAV